MSENTKTPAIPKGTKILCPSVGCETHIFTVVKDVYKYDILSADLFIYPDGTTPRTGTVVTCPKCKESCFNGTQIYTEKGWLPE